MEFALHGAEPNPAVQQLWVSFSLPNASPATLALYDLAGRRVRAREVGGMGTGKWRVNLDEGEPLPAGIYQMTLTRGRASLTRPVVVIR